MIGCSGVVATDSPEISVVIPTHNRWPLLSTGALPSALAQHGVRHEVIVIDDGSGDETVARLGDLHETRLRVICHEHPLGVAVARNAGVAAARGEWVAFLDDDDLWSPLKLRKQLNALHATDASFVYSDVVVLDELCRVTHAHAAPEPDDLPTQLLARYVIPGGLSNVVARTEVVRGLGGFDEMLSMTADWDFLLRLARAGVGTRCPGVLLATRGHTGNMPVRSPWQELMRDLDHFVEKHRSAGLSIDKAGFARWLALQRHRGGKTLDASYRLLQLSLRFRRPWYALQGLRLLVPRRDKSSTSGADAAPEPAWLAEFRGVQLEH